MSVCTISSPQPMPFSSISSPIHPSTQHSSCTSTVAARGYLFSENFSAVRCTPLHQILLGTRKSLARFQSKTILSASVYTKILWNIFGIWMDKEKKTWQIQAYARGRLSWSKCLRNRRKHNKNYFAFLFGRKKKNNLLRNKTTQN